MDVWDNTGTGVEVELKVVITGDSDEDGVIEEEEYAARVTVCAVVSQVCSMASFVCVAASQVGTWAMAGVCAAPASPLAS